MEAQQTETPLKIYADNWRDTKRDMARANKKIGQFWFSTGATGFFKSRISERADSSGLFISREVGPNGCAAHTLRQFLPSAKVATIGEFNSRSLAQCRDERSEISAMVWALERDPSKVATILSVSAAASDHWGDTVFVSICGELCPFIRTYSWFEDGSRNHGVFDAITYKGAVVAFCSELPGSSAYQ